MDKTNTPQDVTRIKGSKENISVLNKPLENKQMISILFQSIQDGLILLNSELTILNINPTMEKWCFDIKPLIGKKCYECFHNRDNPCSPCPALKCMKSGNPEKEIHRGPKDSGVEWLSIYSFPVKDPSTGETEGVLEFLRDITDTKRIEDELRTSKEMMQFVMNAIPGMIFWKDTNSVYLGCNENFARVAGVGNPKNIVGKTDYDLAWKKEEADWFVKYDRQVMAADKARYHVIEPQKHADGKEAWLDANKVPLHNTENKIIGVMGCYDDITERMQTQQEILQLRNYLSNIINSMPSILIGVDKNCRVILWNVEAEKQTGIKPDDATGELLSKVFSRLAGEMEKIKASIRSQQIMSESKRKKIKDGEVLYEDITIYPLLTEDLEGAVIRVDDVTEQVLMEDRQRENLEQMVEERTAELEKEKEKAEAANYAKSVFLSNMSHELRTPLNAILGFTQLMERDLTIGKEQREEIRIINRSGQHLLSLINDVLDIAKIEAGQETLHEKSFDLYPFFSGISEMFHSRCVEKGLSFTLEKDADVHRYVKGDEGKLRQVLINMLGNALKFTETGGLTLRVRSDDATEAIQTLHFEVEDTGIGIASDNLENIFDPFVQASASTDKPAGTGLGLTISRQFVNLMGGSIEVESKINKGSLFRFKVAVGRTEATKIEDASLTRRVIGLAPGQPSFRILVVEDILDSRKLLVKLLETVGFEVQEASNGKQGVEAFHSWHPDLIWMDMRMPIMDGYEATKQIKSTDAGKKTVVIALTAHAFKEERQQILNIGCDDFIRKPYLEEELFAAMEKHLKIKFVYEDQDSSLLDLQKKPADILTPETLAELPEEMKANLLKATANLDQRSCLVVIEQLHESHKDVASALRTLVENYQFKELENILEQKTNLD